MKLPNHDRAIVPQRKIVDYLLSFTHRDGRSKAVFFTQFGFSAETWERFAEALRYHAEDHDVVTTENTAFGINYVVEGRLNTPTGSAPYVRVVWFMETGETIPRNDVHDGQ